jgi:hippurate hydrolase
MIRFPAHLPCIALIVLGFFPLHVSADETPQQWIDTHLPQLVALYRHLHQHPELSFQERETGLRLAEELTKAGLKVTTGVGGHGVVGLLENGTGPTLMLRTDTDALPVAEKTELVYASQAKAQDPEGKEVSVMHACGHDIHMTNLVASTRYLAENRDRWRGTLMVICQPAEERGSGAKAMLKDGLFTRFPKPDYALALHVDSALPVGQIGYRAGYLLANVDSVDITLLGRGGHGAYPHTTVDPIVMAAQLILDLQSIVSREVDPQDTAVITVGSVHSGTKHNIVPDSCHLQLTVRSYQEKTRAHLLEAIGRKASAIAQSARAPAPQVVFSEGVSAMKNDPALVERILPVLQKLLGDDHVVPAEPSMGGEDFSEYGLAGVPICMLQLGSVEPARLAQFQRVEQLPPSLHSATYYPDAEPTLRTGFLVTTAVAINLLPTNQK